MLAIIIWWVPYNPFLLGSNLVIHGFICVGVDVRVRGVCVLKKSLIPHSKDLPLAGKESA